MQQINNIIIHSGATFRLLLFQLNKVQAELNGMERELARNEKALENAGDAFQEPTKDSDKFQI
ncbi:hypothetical protein K8O96_06140 [Clostridium sporogenes]|uniref:Uncharacterized protein n=1 Tax=Clostridium botulinum TaxID=1491 RepID=A0A6M0SYG0_CLOBO|nr:hypothetical protein [Clostridium sporogenes]NFA58931.1 hypothetical protein [Clostridium botulinum]NFI73514.1 hypothetical protein [Clostridium sporogenes]NFP61238.1 hypothetical protein [Clostridium sporogenes]NFV67587.1 hypothetical protein [Clostridium botulinum]UAL60942.1 hypothetical protein K8O96_06140 [Clostridium sporogenes]